MIAVQVNYKYYNYYWHNLDQIIRGQKRQISILRKDEILACIFSIIHVLSLLAKCAVIRKVL